MKKLLLLTAILAIGTTAFGAEVSNGFSQKGYVRTDNGGGEKAFNEYNITNGNGWDIGNPFNDIRWSPLKEVDNTTHKAGAVNVFRDKGEGWKAEAETKVALRILQPIKIEAEAYKIYLESVQGDKVEIGDIEFLVTGQADADISFEFVGLGSQNIFDLPGSATLTSTGYNHFFRAAPLGQTFNTSITGQGVQPYSRRYEIDLYLDIPEEAIGVHAGIIQVTGIYR